LTDLALLKECVRLGRDDAAIRDGDQCPCRCLERLPATVAVFPIEARTVEICSRSAAGTSPKSIRSGLSSAGTSPKTIATPGSTSARTVDAVVESISESGAGSPTTAEPTVLLWPFSSGPAISIESEGSCMRSPPREDAQRPDVVGVHRRSVRLDALRLSSNLVPSLRERQDSPAPRQGV
jgi:hypothetical protein